MVLQGEGYRRSRNRLLETLADYVDARIHYAAGDPEWRSSRDLAAATERLEAALDELFKHA